MDDLRPGSRLGQYELLLRIGRGGMATVWVARHRPPAPAPERIVALKAIHAELADDPEFVNMFLDEGNLIRMIRHENVVQLYDVGEDQGVVYLAMEWIEGESLHTLIAEAGRRRPIPPELAVRIIADVAAGLHAAHETRGPSGELLGVVHRDVSPHNILVGTNGTVKLVDFGVAKAMDRLSAVTSAGQVKGKFSYMAPEQAVARPVDRRADVFALGIVLYELTTGRRLFRGATDAETLHLVVRGEIPLPSRLLSDYPPGLESIVMKALARSRSERYQTTLEMQQALEGFLRSERMVVARAGLGALLRRVLGKRIEERRRLVREALVEVDAEAGTRGELVPLGDVYGSAPELTDPGRVAGTSVSRPHSSGTLGPLELSQISVVMMLPQEPPSRNLFPFFVAGAGLLVAAAAVGMLFFGPRDGSNVEVQFGQRGSAAASGAGASPSTAATTEARGTSGGVSGASTAATATSAGASTGPSDSNGTPILDLTGAP